jgi:hypothetical protein
MARHEADRAIQYERIRAGKKIEIGARRSVRAIAKTSDAARG